MIPVGVSLRQHGASKGAVASFLLSTPQTGVDSILVTYSLLGWVFTAYRVVVAFATGIIGGLIIDWFAGPNGRGSSADAPATTESAPEPPSSKESPGFFEQLRQGLKYGLVTLPRDIGKALILGLLIAALISTLFPTDALSHSVLGSGLLPMLVLMAIGIPMYVCATASVPVAAALITAGVSPGAALVFLISGPATNAATIAAIWKILGRRTALTYLAVVAFGALGAGALLDLFMHDPAIATTVHRHSELLPGWFSQASAVVLLVLLVAALWPRSKKVATNKAENNPGRLTLNIEGMHCMNCAGAVKRALESKPGVVSVQVDLEGKRAEVQGGEFNTTELVQAVEQLGYKASPA